MASIFSRRPRKFLKQVAVFLLVFMSAWVFLHSHGISHRLQFAPEGISNNIQASSIAEIAQRPVGCIPPPLRFFGRFFHSANGTGGRFTISQEPQPAGCESMTPLIIPFGSNFCLLQQTVLSYIAEGWPASQIIVVDNTGFGFWNSRGNVPESSHAFLNYSLLLQDYGVHIYRSPVRQSFSQLQNLLLELAREQNWHSYYVSHQDVVVRGPRSNATKHRQLLYDHVLLAANDLENKFPMASTEWAFCFFKYDWLVRVNVLVAERIGPWDVLIPWYMTDCDYYGRARLEGLAIVDYYIGEIYDVSTCLPDPEVSLFAPHHSVEYKMVDDRLVEMQASKEKDPKGRNTWQGRQQDGLISIDFGPRYLSLVDAGRRNFRKKWQTDQCDFTSKHPSLGYWIRSWIFDLLFS